MQAGENTQISRQHEVESLKRRTKPTTHARRFAKDLFDAGQPSKVIVDATVRKYGVLSGSVWMWLYSYQKVAYKVERLETPLDSTTMGYIQNKPITNCCIIGMKSLSTAACHRHQANLYNDRVSDDVYLRARFTPCRSCPNAIYDWDAWLRKLNNGAKRQGRTRKFKDGAALEKNGE
jgi:hypothetical protein